MRRGPDRPVPRSFRGYAAALTLMLSKGERIGVLPVDIEVVPGALSIFA